MLPQSLKMGVRHFITMSIPGNLSFPKLNICFRFSRISTSFMPMPEATIHHYCHAIFRKDNIRTSRQFVIMQTKAEPTRMKPLPNQNFRFGVLATDRRHAVTTLALTKRIWHGKYFHKVEENIGSTERFNKFFH